MSSGASKLSTLCFRCGVDTTDQPRAVDPSGRQLCAACAIARDAEHAPEIIPVVESEPQARTGPPCRGCGASMAPGAILCLKCGRREFRKDNKSPRIPADETARRAIKCAECGYDLSGLPTSKCPECGHVTRGYTRSEALEKDSIEVARWAYKKPAIIFGIGFLAAVGIMLAVSGGSATRTGVYLAAFPVRVVISVAVYWICCLTWLGFDAPLKLVTLRMAAILACVDVAIMLTSAVGFVGAGMIKFVLAGIVYVYLIWDLFELDMEDARLLAAITLAANLGIIGVLMYKGWI